MTSDPASCQTLMSLLELRAEKSPSGTAFIIDEREYTWHWLWESVRSFGSLLIDRKVNEKERIIVMVPNSAGFFIAFYGCIISGAIPVPVFPGAGTDRCGQIARLSGSRNIIIPENTDPGRKSSFTEWSLSENIQIHWVSESLTPVGEKPFPRAAPDDIAFIQYTSGSTAFPRGVPLSHDNLLTNIRQMVEAMDITSADVFISWLPVYHDMGLILNTMVPFYTGAGLVLLEEGLHKVHSWLKSIERHRGTFISAPDTAYRLCVKSIRRPQDYDLSSLRVALNASEPLHLNTFKLFEGTFGLNGVMVSGYGLAESTVAVSMSPPGEPPRIDTRGYVSSGKPLEGIKVKIKTSDNQDSHPEDGEILIKSPAMMKGYFNRNKAEDPFDSEGYLCTGDIGYTDEDGYLYVLGRQKNIILQAGYTLYADDVEEVVRSVEMVRKAAAVGVGETDNTNQSLYIFAESKWQESPPGDECHDTAVEIVHKIFLNFGIRPAGVYILKPKTLPVTPNGKLRHTMLKSLYIANSPELTNKILYP